MLIRRVLSVATCQQSFPVGLLSARTMSSDNQSEVILNVVNGKGVIRLNRPKALNALNLSMINQMYPVLKVVCQQIILLTCQYMYRRLTPKLTIFHPS